MQHKNSEVRLKWLADYAAEHGIATISEKLVAPEQFVQALLDGKRTFTDSLVSKIESTFSLAEGTIDSYGTVG